MRRKIEDMSGKIFSYFFPEKEYAFSRIKYTVTATSESAKRIQNPKNASSGATRSSRPIAKRIRRIDHAKEQGANQVMAAI